MTDETTALKEAPSSDKEMLRERVNGFFKILARMLVSNGRKLSWRKCRRTWLLMRLRQEVEELDEAMNAGLSEDVKKECMDVAAFAMMIWDLEHLPCQYCQPEEHHVPI